MRTRFKYFMPERCELSVAGSESLLSVSEYYGVKPRSEAFDADAAESRAESLEGYRIVRAGDFVMNYMLAWKGAYGVSDFHGIVSPAYAVYRIDRRFAHGRFVHHRLRSQDMRSRFRARSKGIVESRLRLYPDTFLSMEIDLPDLETQKSIADFLDRETARIDHLIEKKKQFLSGVSQRIDALVGEAISDANKPRVRFEHLAERVTRAVDVSEHEELVRLGLYNRGRGIFKKPAADEEGMGDSDFFFVKSGDLILSGQFAWEGAVALAGEAEDGCVVSHRYPVYVGRKGVKTAYLLGLLRSSFGAFLLNEASRGSAGRNRPLNTWRLGKEKVPVANDALQSEVEKAVHLERQLREKTTKSIERLGEFRGALITAAVTGQLEVETWAKRGTSESHLTLIQEAVGE